ncbi:hypothetical protein J6T21_04470 [Candidatus Saccharibacteria bacterium]|nr:hypothetical protein [Candidatus Saccharibacteria bacterium]
MRDEYRKIWEAYEAYSKTCFVIRKGHEIMDGFDSGLFEKSGSELFLSRGESVAEHQAKTALLMNLCLDDKYFAELVDFNVSREEALKYELVSYSLFHDIGSIETGDVLKDGTELDTDKRILENRQERAYNDFVEKAFSRDAEIYTSWQRWAKQGDYKKYDVVKIATAIRQLETVLSIAFLEKNGIVGNINRKRVISPELQTVINAIGTDNVLDAFAGYMKLKIGNCLSFWQKKLIYGIMESALLDIRGEFFPWWKKIDDTSESFF